MLGDAGVPLTDDVVQNLTQMLDEKIVQSHLAMKRPQSQVVGYSLAETATPGMNVVTNPMAYSEEKEAQGMVKSGGMAATPGAVYVPPSVADKNAGLPIPSKTREGSGGEAGEAEASGQRHLGG